MVRIPTVKSEGKVTALECIAFTLPTAGSGTDLGGRGGFRELQPPQIILVVVAMNREAVPP